jgi:Ca2+-binding RTX toxin-like protein
MAEYHYTGPGANLFTAYQGGSLKERFLYKEPDQFGILNADGSKTFFHGTGLVWREDLGRFIAGTVTRIAHYSASGAFIDELQGLSSAMTRLDTLLRSAGTVEGAAHLQAVLLAGDDTLTGGHHADVFNAYAGHDTLNGGDANDSLTGGSGGDSLNGGDGFDWANYLDSASGVSINLARGTAAGGDATGDVLTGIENISGSAQADTLIGDSQGNALNGGAGDDILKGGDGEDWAIYRQSAAGVTIDLAAGTASHGDAAGDRLIGIENLEGTGFYDLLRGDAGNNRLIGNGGGDTLHGGDGNDWLDGGSGADFLTGQAGVDKILGGSGSDVIDAGTGRDIVKGGQGNDTIYGGPDPDIIIYDFAWSQLTATYDSSDFSIWVTAPDGTDHIFSALTLATLSGTYRYDVPTGSWVHESVMTGNDWLMT